MSHTDWSSLGRPADNVPAQFVPDPAYLLVPDTVVTCLVHLVDLRDSTRLTLAESDAGPDPGSARGDYEVSPAGRYHVRPAERLRLDCRTRRAIGIVGR